MFKLLLVFFTTIVVVYCSSYKDQGECLDPMKKVGHMYHYSGTRSVTKSGETCQRWADNNSPQEIHVLTDDIKKRKEFVNYCREFETNESEKPWCYTTNPSVRWEICDIPICKYTPDPNDCLDPAKKVGHMFHYSGTRSYTKSGERCQRWADNNSPNEVKVLTDDVEKRKEFMDYCREIDDHESKRPWCYTTNPDKHWEYCDIPACQYSADPNDCLDPAKKVGHSYQYSGTRSYTESGETCQRWADDFSPNEVKVLKDDPEKRKEFKNYCRELDEEVAPWCYTLDAEMRWDYCNIPFCKPSSSSISSSNSVSSQSHTQKTSSHVRKTPHTKKTSSYTSRKVPGEKMRMESYASSIFRSNSNILYFFFIMLTSTNLIRSI